MPSYAPPQGGAYGRIPPQGGGGRPTPSLDGGGMDGGAPPALSVSRTTDGLVKYEQFGGAPAGFESCKSGGASCTVGGGKSTSHFRPIWPCSWFSLLLAHSNYFRLCF